MAQGGQTGGMGGAQTAAPGGGMGVGTGQPPAMGSMQMPSYMQQPMMGMMGGYGGMRGGMQQPMMGGYGRSPFMGGGFGGDYGGYGQSPFMGGMRGPRGGMGFNPYGGGYGPRPMPQPGEIRIDYPERGQPYYQQQPQQSQPGEIGIGDFMRRQLPYYQQQQQQPPQFSPNIDQLIDKRQYLQGVQPGQQMLQAQQPGLQAQAPIGSALHQMNAMQQLLQGAQPGQQPRALTMDDPYGQRQNNPRFAAYNAAMASGNPQLAYAMKQGGIASLIKK
ncbi:MAG: hypothetical protein EBZ60_07250 [Betaproteobacteria bacterium]|nr:hypothetical protein [Betaproteobacteria bacterium]